MPPPSVLLSHRAYAQLPSQPRHGRSDSVMSMTAPEEGGDQLSPLSPPLCTPPIQMATAGFNILTNPRSRLLRRSSSVSTLGSIHDSEDELEIDWSTDDLEKLKTIYDRIVDEAMLETPFNGTPPSQLLHAIARACKRVYKDEWKHSIAHTRAKALVIARERLSETEGDVHATPRPGTDVDATPKRRRLCRNDSVDFLPFNRDLTSVTRLSDKLHRTSEDIQPFFSARQGSQPSLSAQEAVPLTAPLSARFGRSMTFADLSMHSAKEEEFATYHAPEHSGPFSARPALRTGSGYIPSHSFASLQQSPVRPSLYALPSFAGSTESTRFNDSIASSIYGSSFASSASFFSSSTSTAGSESTLDSQSASDGMRFYATPNKKRLHEDSAFSDSQSSEFTPSSVTSSVPSANWSASTGRSAFSKEDSPVTPSPASGGGQLDYFSSSSPCMGQVSYFGSGHGSPMKEDISQGEAKAPRLFIQSPSKSPEPRAGGRMGHAKSASAHLRLQNSWILPQKAQAAPQLMTLKSPFDGNFNLDTK